MSTKSVDAQDLLDDRGAVMVMGIFMCTCLVGALWYLAAIGDAILYRERLQEAADAVAFSNAVLHARGMNLIVLINLIMACVLGVRVALKVAQLVLVIAGVVFFVIGIFVSPFLEAAKLCADGAQKLQNVLTDTKETIDNSLKALSKAQTVIAKATPAAAEAGAVVSVGDKYKPVATQSLVLDTEITTGLPVEAGSEDKLCKEAGRSVGGLLGWVLSKVGLDVFGEPTKWLGDKIGAIASLAPGYFCEIGSGGASPDGAIDGILGEAAEERCSDGGPASAYEQAETQWQDACKDAGVTCVGDDGSGAPADMRIIFDKGEQRGTTTPEQQDRLDVLRMQRDAAADSHKSYRETFGGRPVDAAECRQWAKDDAKRQMEQKKSSFPANGSASKSNGKEMTGKKVKSDWFNGGPNGQLVGGVIGDASRLQRSAELVRVGAVGDRRADRLDVPTAAKMPAWAQAEFFFDCGEAWASCNADEDAMWHLKWRARLRRYNAAKAVDQLPSLFAGSASVGAGFKGVQSLASGSARHQQINTLPGSAALIGELGAALANPTTATRGIH
ncbi:MAG TPA: hypothetical protein VM580_23895 [Labilithrix sp.]|nr:hypothetical protein [Labilithrix sp.]